MEEKLTRVLSRVKDEKLRAYCASVATAAAKTHAPSNFVCRLEKSTVATTNTPHGSKAFDQAAPYIAAMLGAKAGGHSGRCTLSMDPFISVPEAMMVEQAGVTVRREQESDAKILIPWFVPLDERPEPREFLQELGFVHSKL
eukprot:GEMP01088553.1.p2 GENE.GEMP01088553.1~~GEMP01088553.1.p2  ORF type:complete len:142 (-),score=37.65 GEMP01088553.1:444-869(-)